MTFVWNQYRLIIAILGGTALLHAHSFPASSGYSTNLGKVATRTRVGNQKMTSEATTTEEGTELSNQPIWDPIQQIYVGGNIPENSEVKALIKKGDGFLRLFGYGSLCWNPGTGALAKDGVTHTLGKARGYKRCWAQRSTDHRGVPKFPGIVCTLLEDQEVKALGAGGNELTMTEGVIYLIPPDLVEECLDELDFREKGGYARDVIQVVEDGTGETHEALLYRGTPDNPAFWQRTLRDLPYAAAVMAVADGPSGKNDFYLHSLDDFLSEAETIVAKADDTATLSLYAKMFEKQNLGFHFLVGSGSNHRNQLLLHSENNVAGLKNGEDAHERTEIAACFRKDLDDSDNDSALHLYAGGGHSGLLTKGGKFYLWGWNENWQLGYSISSPSDDSECPFPIIEPLGGIKVADAALGFSHTMVIEKSTRRLVCFGSNERGQVDGETISNRADPSTPAFLQGERISAISAGLYHSAAITESGELYTFGCGRFGQCLSNVSSDEVCVGKWRPEDGSKLLSVACGRRHTVVVDEKGQIWTFGENKYGQLGRKLAEDNSKNRDPVPRLVTDSDTITIQDPKNVKVVCGWSHTVICEQRHDGSAIVHGWGRNDQGQLGLDTNEHVDTPTRLFTDVDVEAMDCGSESTLVLDKEGNILGCGWNEHGNLGIGSNKDAVRLVRSVGSRIVAPHDGVDITFAAGGAHFLAARVQGAD